MGLWSNVNIRIMMIAKCMKSEYIWWNFESVLVLVNKKIERFNRVIFELLEFLKRIIDCNDEVLQRLTHIAEN